VVTVLRVILVEDEPWVRKGVETLLRDKGCTVQAFARGADAIAAASRGAVDAAVVDIGLPDMSGIEVIAELRQVAPACVSVAFTQHDDPATVLGALRAGARGYLVKNAASDRIVPSLREAIAGGMPLSPSVAALVVEIMLGAESPAASKKPLALTARETELLSLLAKGATYAQAAGQLGIGVGTVQSYVKSIYAKLDVGSKAEAAVIAVRLGLVT
jgi:DNA-binding NarL/FixJ family response regulator